MKLYMLTLLWMLIKELECALGDCPAGCKCDGSKLECDEIMPDFIPDFITEVIVYEASLGKWFDFSDPGWMNVTQLSINPGFSVFHDRPEPFRTLHENEFSRLENLEKLQIACKCLGKIQEKAFYGLNKLKVLDLSNNAGLSIDSVVQGLTGDVLPNLSEIYLSNTSVLDFESFLLGTDFLQAVKNKRLKVLDISNTKDAWFHWDMDLLTAFPVLEKLNISAAGLVIDSLMAPFASIGMHPLVTSFKNLKSLDISYPSVQYRVTDSVFGNNMPHETSHMHAPVKLKELYAKRLLTSDSGKIHATSNSTHLCFWEVPKERNHQFCYVGKSKKLEKLVFTENMIHHIESNVWKCFRVLQYLDLASNKLGDAFADGGARSIIDMLKRLEVFILSNNGIYNIPKDTFRGGRCLQILDLSSNELEAITFDTENLVSLRTLDLSNNKLAVLDELSLGRFSNLFHVSESLHVPTAHNRSANITLNGNPFLCSCKNIQFLKWLTNLNHSYTCIMNSEQHFIDDSLVLKSEYVCKEKIIIAVFGTLSVVTAVLLVAMVYLLLKERKKFLQSRQTKMGIELYSVNVKTTSCPPVFLSFCSEDDQKVMDYILPNLEKSLRKILRTSNQCVATGYNSFRPGFSLANEIMRCVEASSVVVLFITNAFCSKMWCKNEALTAHIENKPIVLMIWETVDIKLMPKHLYNHYQQYASVHWVQEDGKRVMKPGWDELCESIVRLFTVKTMTERSSEMSS